MRERAGPMLFLFLLALMMVPLSARATYLNPTSPPVAPSNVPVGSFCPGVGCPVLLVDSKQNVAFGNGAVSGTLDTVVLSDPSNVFCAGCLDFEIQIDTNTGPDGIDRIEAYDFAGFKVDVGVDNLFAGIYSIPAGTAAAPDTVDRKTSDTIGFNFSGLTQNNGSVILEIETNATSYSKNGNIGISDGITDNVAGFEPTGTPSVPEASGFSLLSLTLLSGGLLRKKLFA